jgi:hypothetical protein
MRNKKWPRIEEVYFVHHNHEDAVSLAESSSLTVIDVKCVTENMSLLVIAKEYWTIFSRAYLQIEADIQVIPKTSDIKSISFTKTNFSITK